MGESAVGPKQMGGEGGGQMGTADPSSKVDIGMGKQEVLKDGENK